MKIAQPEDMELGNMMFGNSRGKYSVEPRMEYQDPFADFLHANGFGMYGENDSENRDFENDTFVLRPYYWGEDDSIAELPNFVYKPTGLEIKWYKYPMRDAYSNQDVDVETFKEILKDCAKSLNPVEPELKPCPFCGGEAHFIDLGINGDFEDWCVECPDCGTAFMCHGKHEGDITTKEEVAKAWNKRK